RLIKNQYLLFRTVQGRKEELTMSECVLKYTYSYFPNKPLWSVSLRVSGPLTSLVCVPAGLLWSVSLRVLGRLTSLVCVPEGLRSPDLLWSVFLRVSGPLTSLVCVPAVSGPLTSLVCVPAVSGPLTPLVLSPPTPSGLKSPDPLWSVSLWVSSVMKSYRLGKKKIKSKIHWIFCLSCFRHLHEGHKGFSGYPGRGRIYDPCGNNEFQNIVTHFVKQCYRQGEFFGLKPTSSTLNK
ncbi:hypothetical protein MJT46_011349, partial [Ovis ammon polii x Ovis aries]